MHGSLYPLKNSAFFGLPPVSSGITKVSSMEVSRSYLELGSKLCDNSLEILVFFRSQKLAANRTMVLKTLYQAKFAKKTKNKNTGRFLVAQCFL